MSACMHNQRCLLNELFKRVLALMLISNFIIVFYFVNKTDFIMT